MSTVVEQIVQARLILSAQRSALLRVTLRYGSEDPLAVRMLFPTEYSLDSETEGDEITWVFARHLLAEGLDAPAGLGDVHLRPTLGRRVMVELRAAEGLALLQFAAADLRRFLWHSYVAVPEGTETDHLDPDRALAELLGNA
ncbi:SsgA family sporulation/cell division regulator [Kitasatospora sp. NPDC002227]|uniref:SsgA family sporulation/cell division regulator n=1 Tax=Kitasatospora sp. NPDC002227 TaxID=3154773 RepID=UPI00332236D9